MKTYAFKGTLLILGACMLHISISAALYRPLAIHVLIAKQYRNVVQLHEASSETIQHEAAAADQVFLNKESAEHQKHMKKLQTHCHHHGHQSQHQNFDPDDIVAKLQVHTHFRYHLLMPCSMIQL